MENINIRKANLKDIESIGELLFGLKSQYGSCSETNFSEFLCNYQDSIRIALQSDNNFIWIATTENDIVGFISYTKRHVIRLRSEILAMEELFVKRDFRRKGVATLLYKESINFFISQNLHSIEVVSSLAHPGQREWSEKIGLEWYSNIHRIKI